MKQLHLIAILLLIAGNASAQATSPAETAAPAPASDAAPAAQAPAPTAAPIAPAAEPAPTVAAPAPAVLVPEPAAMPVVSSPPVVSVPTAAVPVAQQSTPVAAPGSALGTRPSAWRQAATTTNHSKSPSQPRRYGDAGAPFTFGIGGGFLWNDDPGYLLVGAKRQGQLEMFTGYDVLQPTRRLVVSLGASYRRHQGDTDALTISDHTLQADLLARFALASWLWPQARASVGATWTRAKLNVGGQGGVIDDRDVSPVGTFGGGLLLRTPTRLFETRRGRLSSLSFGVLTEAGYTFANPASFAGRPSGGTPDIERSSVKLGSISRNAPYVRIMGVIRF